MSLLAATINERLAQENPPQLPQTWKHRARVSKHNGKKYKELTWHQHKAKLHQEKVATLGVPIKVDVMGSTGRETDSKTEEDP